MTQRFAKFWLPLSPRNRLVTEVWDAGRGESLCYNCPPPHAAVILPAPGRPGRSVRGEPQMDDDLKARVCAAIDQRRDDLTAFAQTVADEPELGFFETRTAQRFSRA